MRNAFALTASESKAVSLHYVKSRPMGRQWSNAGSRWTAELVAYALDRYHRRHLRMPTVREIRAGVEGLPSHAIIRRRYCCGTRLSETPGTRVRPPGSPPR